MINKKSTVVTKEKELITQPIIQVNTSNQNITNTLASLPINLYIDATDYYFLMLEQCA
jgi:hypothetical protein